MSQKPGSIFTQADADRIGFNAGQRTNMIVEAAEFWAEMETVKGPRASESLLFVAEDAFRAMDAYSALYAEKQAEAERITAALALLDSPQPGTTVALISGETWEFGGRNWTYSSPELRGYPVLDEALRATLIELVAHGGAKVTAPSPAGDQEGK